MFSLLMYFVRNDKNEDDQLINQSISKIGWYQQADDISISVIRYTGNSLYMLFHHWKPHIKSDLNFQISKAIFHALMIF